MLNVVDGSGVIVGVAVLFCFGGLVGKGPVGVEVGSVLRCAAVGDLLDDGAILVTGLVAHEVNDMGVGFDGYIAGDGEFQNKCAVGDGPVALHVGNVMDEQESAAMDADFVSLIAQALEGGTTIYQ